MKRLSVIVLLSMFAAAPAMAQNAACTAMSADGKPLSGAAKKSSIDKCMKG